mmetsp:Transcript_14466/g.42809  ORF Transcript_14466/g.42809 Transcript_14466/m.42809 type:complete len:228 (-) Transcript_14466:156-839(-)
MVFSAPPVPSMVNRPLKLPRAAGGMSTPIQSDTTESPPGTVTFLVNGMPCSSVPPRLKHVSAAAAMGAPPAPPAGVRSLNVADETTTADSVGLNSPTWKVKYSPAVAVAANAGISPPRRAHRAGSARGPANIRTIFSRVSVNASSVARPAAATTAACSSGVATNSIAVKPWNDSPDVVWSFDPGLLGRFSRRTTGVAPGITVAHMVAAAAVVVTHPSALASPEQLYQ